MILPETESIQFSNDLLSNFFLFFSEYFSLISPWFHLLLNLYLIKCFFNVFFFRLSVQLDFLPNHFLIIQLFHSNWNNKILKIEYGSIYASWVIVANLHKWISLKNLEAKIITVVLRMLKHDAMSKHPY